MSWRSYLVLAVLGFVVALAVAQFQRFPGYMDADYYFSGGEQLVLGRGFSEPYLWNYLSDPPSLPSPSHSYWMPLASIISALGMSLMGQTTYVAARLGFLLLAAMAPVVTAALAYSFSQQRRLALVSGLLAVFSGYYVPFMAVPDNYGVYLLLGAAYLLVMKWRNPISFAIMGAIAGAMSLARSDGILWLALTALVIVSRCAASIRTSSLQPKHSLRALSMAAGTRYLAGRALLALLGFFVVFGPWLWRNHVTYGSLLAPGGSRLLWLRTYDETFTYPADQLTARRWLDQGWLPILTARAVALRWNLLNALAAQGEIFLVPFILIGAWVYRGDERVRIGLVGWTILLLVMTVLFPFAGSRGGFFHAGAGFQALWWAMAPAGLDTVVAAARRRGMFTPQAPAIFGSAIVGLAALLTLAVFGVRVWHGWGEGEQNYATYEEFLIQKGINPDDVVMVRNPPGYYMLTGRSAIVTPYGDADAIRAAARRYGAKYLILEKAGAAGPIESVYEDTTGQYFSYLGDLDGTHIYSIDR